MKLILARARVIATVGITLAWASNNWLRQTVWGELARVPAELGSSRYVRSLSPTVLDRLGTGRTFGAGVAAIAAIAAVVVAFGGAPSFALRRDKRLSIALVAAICLIATADAFAALAYPYGRNWAASASVQLRTAITASRATARSGQEVDYTVTASNPSTDNVTHVALVITLAPDMKLVGAPYYERGSGCKGSIVLTCNLDFLESEMSTLVRFGVLVTDIGLGEEKTVRASVSSHGVASDHSASFAIRGVP